MATASQRKKTLTITADKRPSVTVRLVGQTYEVIKPKSSLSLLLADLTDSEDGENAITASNALEWKNKLYDVIDNLFGAKSDNVKERLADPKDDLDIEHVMDTVKKVTEYFGKENPTT